MPVSCGQSHKEVAWLIEQAETVLEQNPDSAWYYLSAVQDPEGLREMQRMNYYLLWMQAKDKTYTDISEDTVICEVKDYFLQKKDFEKATLAAFYEGLVFNAGKDRSRALQAFLEAENIAEHIMDTKRKGLIQHNIGGLYYTNKGAGRAGGGRRLRLGLDDAGRLPGGDQAAHLGVGEAVGAGPAAA